ncbi:MarR family transcriptional regulator [Kitasatospora sp. NPDC002040]|uniref:MarR family winged helix-turn-helix transcriptional regulator n=1 Tax=Kitasatospora sp. NPDC002040 TaxID=3154661 RepID=UPI003326AC35
MTDVRAVPTRQPSPPVELGDALSHLQCALVARRAGTNPEGINRQQYDVLEMLRIRGAMNPSRLSESLGVSRPSISKALRVLKDLELVQQAALGDDRRALTTSLTPKGHAFMAKAARSRQEDARAAASVLSPGEQALFTEMCEKVAAAIDVLLP